MQFYSTPYGNFLHSFKGDLISCARLVSSVGVEPGILILSPVVTARMGWQRSEKCHKGSERCDRKRN